MSTVKDPYFNRKFAEWDIIKFLDESKEESFEQRLDSYIKSLKIIANTEQGKRQEKAQLLIDNYRKGSRDRQRAKEWEKRHMSTRTASGPMVNFHNSKVMGIGIGTINGGTFGVGLPKRTEKISKPRFEDTASNEEDSDSESENEEEEGQGLKHPRHSIDPNIHGISDDNNADPDVGKMSNSDYNAFNGTYYKMDNTKKWVLSTGKVVEDSLHEFGLRCAYEHLSHSFILDPDDQTYLNEGVFTNSELSEIRKFQAKDIPAMPRELLKYLNSFDVTTTSELRKLVFRPEPMDQQFSRLEHFDRDWIRNTIYNLLVSSERKNCERTVSALLTIKRKTLGRRGDLLIRKISTEYGCAEAGRLYEGENGTKLLKERGLKTPKMMKDIFYQLCKAVDQDEQKVRKLESIGFLHAGLTMMLLRMDSPAGYICRVSRTKLLSIPSKVVDFGAKALPTILLAWKAKKIVANVLQLMEQKDEAKGDEEDQLQYLQDSCERSPAKLKRPRISFPSSLQTPEKKRTGRRPLGNFGPPIPFKG